MRGCPYEGDPANPCAINKGFAFSLMRPCASGEYGTACADIVAQWMVASTINPETLSSTLDEGLGLIDATFRLTQVPAGEAPAAIRQSISRVTFPLRQNRPQQPGKVFVHHEDLALSLLNSEKLEEANWYNSRLAELNRQLAESGQRVESWAFEEAEGAVNELAQPTTSLANYDRSFRMGSASLWNCMIPPLLVVREMHKPPGNYPIAEYFATT